MPPKIDNDVVFSMNASPQGYLSVFIRSVYVELAAIFGNTLDRMGRGQREESAGLNIERSPSILFADMFILL